MPIPQSDEYKYAEHMNAIQNCPPTRLLGEITTAFRFVFTDLEDDRNHSPPAVIKPTRKFKDDSARCSGFALSFFISEADACNFFENLKRLNQNVHKTVGNCLATCEIRAEDGKHSAPDDEGHVDFFESCVANFRGRLQQVKVLCDA